MLNSTRTFMLSYLIGFFLGMGPTWPVRSAPPENHPGQPFAEMTAQHDIILQALDDGTKALQADIAEVKTVIEARLTPPCGENTEDRFVPRGNDVCDNSTGLVWQQSPSLMFFTWDEAKNHCNSLGYALPETQQLISLVDFDAAFQNSKLNEPQGPFSHVQRDPYWTVNRPGINLDFAWQVDFGAGNVNAFSQKSDGLAWCVREDQS